MSLSLEGAAELRSFIRCSVRGKLDVPHSSQISFGFWNNQRLHSESGLSSSRWVTKPLTAASCLTAMWRTAGALSVLSAGFDGGFLSSSQVAAGLLPRGWCHQGVVRSNSCIGQRCQSAGSLLPHLEPGPGRRGWHRRTDGRSWGGDTHRRLQTLTVQNSQTSVYQITWMKIKWSRDSILRGDVGFGMLLYQLPLGIDSENPVQRNTHLLIGIHILKSHIHKQSASPPKATIQSWNTIYIMYTNNYYDHIYNIFPVT